MRSLATAHDPPPVVTIEMTVPPHAEPRDLEMTLPRSPIVLAIVLLVPCPAFAQLPADAVILEKVKIPEIQKSIDLCPVYLVPSDPKLSTWEYKGVKYRGSKPDAREKFSKDPAKFAKA